MRSLAPGGKISGNTAALGGILLVGSKGALRARTALDAGSSGPLEPTSTEGGILAAPDFDRLLEHSTWLRPMARALVRDEHLAEDVLQETWVAALRSPPNGAPHGPWLSRVLRNVVRMHARTESRRTAREAKVARPEGESSPPTTDLLELRLELVHALLEVREPFRSTLILRFYDDLSAEQIAKAEGIPAATVRGRLKRGIDQLRGSFEKRGKAGLLAVLIIADLPELSAAELWPAYLETGGLPPMPEPALPRSFPFAVIPLLLITAVWLVGFGGGDPLSSSPTPHASAAGAESETTSSDATSGASSLAGNANIDRRDTNASEIPNVDVIAPAPISEEIDLPDDPALRATLRVVDRNGQSIAGAEIGTATPRYEAGQIAAGFGSTAEFLLRDATPISLGTTNDDGEIELPSAILLSQPIGVTANRYREHREGTTRRVLQGGVYTVALDPAPLAEIEVRAPAGMALGAATIELLDGDRTVTRTLVPDEPLGSEASITLPIEGEMVRVRAFADGFASRQEILTHPFHRIELVPGEPQQGRIVDEDGRPAEGATVRLRESGSLTLPWAVTTDAAGVFATPVLPIDGEAEWTLTVSHDEYLAQEQSLFPSEEGVIAEIQLARGLPLSGSVLDSAGQAVADARVSIASGVQFYSRDVKELQTKEDGSFSLPAIADGITTVRVEAPGFAPQERTFEARSGLAEPIVLVEGRTQSGQVIDSEGVPVAGVTLRLGTIFGDEVRGMTVTTDDEGSFTFENVPVDSVTHRPRRRVLRWTALSDAHFPTADAWGATTNIALLEVFRPAQLLEANGVAIDAPAHFGSRNTAAVDLSKDGDWILRVEPLEATAPLRFLLEGVDGAPIAALTNVLIASPEDWTMKDFAGWNGQPFHLPNPWVLDGADLTVMTRGYPWRTVRLDLRRSNGTVRISLDPPWNAPPELTIEPARAIELLVRPIVDGVATRRAIPIGATDEEGTLTLADLGPGRYQLVTPIEPENLWRKNGKRKTSLPPEEVRTIGFIELNTQERQEVSIIDPAHDVEKEREE